MSDRHIYKVHDKIYNLHDFLKKSFPRPMLMKDSPTSFIDICLILRHLLLHSLYDKKGQRYICLHYEDVTAGCRTKVAEINKSSSMA